MTVTDKSPKRFRFTLVSRLQNYALDVIENLIMANETFVGAGDMLGAWMNSDKRRYGGKQQARETNRRSLTLNWICPGICGR